MVIPIEKLFRFKDPVESIIGKDSRCSDFKTLIVILFDHTRILHSNFGCLIHISLTREVGFIKIICLKVVKMDKIHGRFELSLLIGTARE
jgi:hypothetical protein